VATTEPVVLHHGREGGGYRSRRGAADCFNGLLGGARRTTARCRWSTLFAPPAACQRGAAFGSLGAPRGRPQFTQVRVKWFQARPREVNERPHLGHLGLKARLPDQKNAGAQMKKIHDGGLEVPLSHAKRAPAGSHPSQMARNKYSRLRAATQCCL